jgi:hypothetical protein
VPDRHFPVQPNLRQLKRQAKTLLRGLRRGDADAVAEFRRNHPASPDPDAAILADAQLALARSYGLPSWPRLVQACEMTTAICRDDLWTVRDLVLRHPALLREDARGVKGNWGPPMSYAANLGRNRIIRMLRDLGAEDVQFAFERACLQGELDAARLLHQMGARPLRGSVMGPCETQNAEGLAFLLELGAELCDEHGHRLAPVAMLLQSYGTSTASIAVSRSWFATASSCPTRRRWPSIAAGSICSSNICSRIRAALADVHPRRELSAGCGM